MYKRQGYKITAVSGSDSRGTEEPEARNASGYGSSATAILSQALSQAAIREAVLGGRALVKTLGVDESPHVELEAFDASGQSVSYGGQLVLDASATATLRLAISGAQGQRLMLYRNGQLQQSQLILSDEEIVQLPIQRDPASEGPLGSWWRFDLVADGLIFNGRPVIGPATTAIGNPVFLSATALE